MDRTETAPASRSQARVSPVFFWAVLAALILRVVTGVMDRGAGDGVGLVRWQPREKAAALARASGKPILYDFTAAWCAPCKMVDRDWEDPALADQVNAAFVPTRVVDRVREDGRNPPEISELQRRYEIVGFPTIVAASPDGALIAKTDGYRGRDAMAQFLEEAAKKP
jgi:thiol:disulfide interchange protein DsbD